MVAASTSQIRNAAIGTIPIAVLLLYLGSPVIARLIRHFGPMLVTACETYEAHGTHARVTLNDSRTIDLTWEDIPNPERCLAIGDVVEKRRGELGFRINGVMRNWENAATYVSFLALSGLFAGISIGLFVWLSKRRKQ
jgi:hypothetical protein